jgi:hypothetical protein
MDNLLSILDTNGLTNHARAQEWVHNSASSEIVSLIEGLREAMLQASSALSQNTERSLDRADFLPSSSLRGSSGCALWDCRAKKIRILSRYIALYCDLAVIPINFDWDYATSEKHQDISSRLSVLASISALIELRPLIEGGLVVVVPEGLRLCKEHWEKAVPGHEKIVNSAIKLCASQAKRFGATYKPFTAGTTRIACVDFTGPDEYIAHGKISRLFTCFPKWVPSKRQLRRWKIPQSTVIKENLVLPFFMPMANDALLQSYFGTTYNARYVTDLPGELEFYRLLSGRDILAEQTASLCARLTHSVPIMEDIPLTTILRTRREDPEAFQNYRSAISGIVKNYVRGGHVVGDHEAREIYSDLLKPQLDALEVKAKNVRRSQVKKGLLRVAATTAVMGLGIYSGLLPSELADLVKAVGGFGVARDLVETVASLKDEAPEVRNHNLYFLLRLKSKSARTSYTPD